MSNDILLSFAVAAFVLNVLVMARCVLKQNTVGMLVTTIAMTLAVLSIIITTGAF